MFTLKSGKEIPFGEFHPLGEGAFSIAPYVNRRTVRFKIMRNSTGEVAKPKACLQAAQDALMMALYCEYVPASYICYRFGAAALDDVTGNGESR